MATLDIILNAMMVGIGSGTEKIGKIAKILRNNKKAR